MFGDMIQGTVGSLDTLEVVVVDNLFFGFSRSDDFDFAGVGAAQRHLEIHDAVLDGVFERGVEDGGHLHPFDEAHLNDALAEGSVARHTHYYTFFTCL